MYTGKAGSSSAECPKECPTECSAEWPAKVPASTESVRVSAGRAGSRTSRCVPPKDAWQTSRVSTRRGAKNGTQALLAINRLARRDPLWAERIMDGPDSIVFPPDHATKAAPGTRVPGCSPRSSVAGRDGRRPTAHEADRGGGCDLSYPPLRSPVFVSALSSRGLQSSRASSASSSALWPPL